MAPESEDPSSPVRDGLTEPTTPLTRERTEQTAPGDDADGSANLDFNFSGADKSGEPEEAPGLNVAAGPAEEEDREKTDERELTTDISPSD